MIQSTPLFSRAWLVLSFAPCVACFQSPERVSVAAAPPAPHAVSNKPVRFGGRVALAGDLAKVQEGSLFLIVRPVGSRMPALTRKYEIGDPAFGLSDGERVLHFSLDERDDMGGATTPMADEMELEARFDPDGFVETPEGVVRTLLRVHPGDEELSIVLPSDAARSEGSPKGS